MVITKPGLYRVISKSFDGLPIGAILKVTKVGDLTITTTIHTGKINNNQPVELIREFKDEI